MIGNLYDAVGPDTMLRYNPKVNSEATILELIKKDLKYFIQATASFYRGIPQYEAMKVGLKQQGYYLDLKELVINRNFSYIIAYPRRIG